MIETKIHVNNKNNERLVGIESAPSIVKEKYPTVLLVHGFGVAKEEGGMFDDIAQHLSDNGLLVYRFDFSGCGESEGDYSETSLSKLKSDLKIILDFIRSQPKVDKFKIGILGQSLGTAAAITLAPDVNCMIMMGSVSRPKETLIKLFGKGYNPSGISTRLKPNGTTTKIKPPFWEDFVNHDLINSMRRIKCPILFIHGSKDDKVPLSNMEEYFKIANEQKEKIIIEGADHGLRPHREQMYQIVSNWFSRNLF